jgi:outer membrane protein OmpA-like peptidoglycan-associated protein
MKKSTLVFLSLIFILTATQAQRYYGIANSNYAGINGLYINPGNIADNRLKLDVQLFSVNVFGNQNYGYLPKLNVLRKAIIDGTDITFNKNNRIDNLGFDLLGEVRGPSFMFQINKKNALGFLSRGRIVGSARGINTNLFTFLNDGIKDVELANGTTFSSGKANITINAFSEMGLVYGTEIVNNGKHYLKGGITLKKYNGIEFSSIRFKDFSIKLIDTATAKVQYNGSIEASKSFNTNNGFDNINTSKLFNGGKGSGFGIDLGVVYEFRDGGPISTARYQNKYKLKVGASIQDIGSMKYKSTSDNENYVINANGSLPVTAADTANIGFDDVSGYFKTISSVTSTKNNNPTKVKAPTTVTLFADLRLKEKLYINALFTGGLVGDKTAGTRMPFQAVITPRFESKFFDAGLPISYNSLSKNVKAGLGLRLGLLFIGSDDIISNLTGLSKLTGGNIYAGLRVGFPYKKPKTKKEKEEEIPEPVKKETVAPKPADTDNDGIIDAEDKCPTVAGKKEFNGCPDTDNDGIIDAEDKCPTVAGIKAFAGCPDTDNDGIQDSEDKCPTVAGIKAFAGCPDTDSDGVADKNDKCINTPGPIDNEGCPKVTERILKRLSFAAQAIQFKLGKDVIKPASYKQLDEVVKILNEYDDYQLIIDGHTDNTGKADKNQLLSEKRAASVKAYFAQKGVDAGRLITTGYGATKPLVANTTAANKAKNRRVELNLKLKD